MSSLLSVNQLSFRYQETARLSAVSFSLAAQQIGVIVGESGSGKTTLLRLVAGLLDPTKGTVLLAGEPVLGPAHRLVPGHPDIRTVFQDFALSPNLSVYQNIAHVLRAYQSDYRHQRTAELIERFRLIGKEEQLPATLSGGERQRVALARALAEEPKLLLMDEPFSQVDAPLKRHLLREVGDILRETGGAALVVTHDAQDALMLADQLLVLQHGKAVQQGTATEIYEHPATPYVAELMGECRWVPVEVWQQWFPQVSHCQRVGVRPEHIRLSDNADGTPAEVVRCRYRGAYYELVMRAEGAELLVYCTERLEVGASISIAIDGDRALYF